VVESEDKVMNKNMLRGKYREVRGGMKREWGKLTHDDRTKMEGELDRMVGLIQQRYGYTQERAAQELEHFVQDYGKRTREALSEPMKQLREHPVRAISLAWIVVAVIGGAMFLLRRNATEKHRRQSTTQSAADEE
jgi:uncharacterized protein YjbJ (UPF0337 family)